jgi:hypothetical protein
LATLTCEIASGIVISRIIVIATIICFFDFNFLNHPFLWRIYVLNVFLSFFVSYEFYEEICRVPVF